MAAGFPVVAANMSGLEKGTPIPTRIVVHKQSRVFEIEYADGKLFRLAFEFMRVYSPSAEVRGHGPGQETLQVGKRDVEIVGVEPVGNYAVQPTFSDGHSSGLYSWDYLYWLGEHQAELWEDYLRRMRDAGASRDPAGDAPAAGGGLEATAVSRPRQ